jgi:hypothetical protein
MLIRIQPIKINADPDPQHYLRHNKGRLQIKGTERVVAVVEKVAKTIFAEIDLLSMINCR